MLGNIEGGRRRGMTEDDMVGWHHNSMNMSLSKLWELVRDREAWCASCPWSHTELDVTELN